jgi:division/cell wall cluster transcriptional repressor MraZ
MSEIQQLAMVELPRGMFPARVDDKGRLKLPLGFHDFFKALREKQLFVTSMDRKVALIYPIAIWRKNEELFESNQEDPKKARLLRLAAFNASDLGSEAEMDSQGRILLSPELRREVGVEDQPVRIRHDKGKIEILSEKVYQERKQQASELSDDDWAELQTAGLN